MSYKSAICFVADFKYLFKYFDIIYQELKNNGKYDGEIVILTSLFSPTFFIKTIRSNKKVSVLRNKKIKFSKKTKSEYLNLNTNGQPNRFKYKNFQWQKIHLFDMKIKY